MRKLLLLLFVAAAFTACNKPTGPNANLSKLFDNYYENKLKLYPIEATSIGDNRYNDQLQNDVSQAFITKAQRFYQSYADSLKAYKREDLDAADQISYDIFAYEMNITLQGFSKHIYFDY